MSPALDLAVGPLGDSGSHSKVSFERLVWAPDGRSIAVFSSALEESEKSPSPGLFPVIRVLEAGTWKETRSRDVPPALVSPVVAAWSPESTSLAIAEDGLLIKWNLQGGDDTAYSIDPGAPLAIRWVGEDSSSDVDVLAMSRTDASIRVVSTPSGEAWHWDLPDPPTWAAWSPDGSRLACISTTHGQLGEPLSRLWLFEGPQDSAQPAGVGWLDLPGGVVENPGWTDPWSPDGRQIAIAVEALRDDFCYLVVWDGSGEPRVRTLELGPLGLFGARWNQDETIISATTGTHILLFDERSLELQQTLPSFFAFPSPTEASDSPTLDTGSLSILGFTRSHGWSPDGSWLIAGNVGGIRVWDP